MLAVTTLAQSARYGFDHMEGWGWGWGVAVFMGMLAALFIALLVWFIVSLAGRRDDTSAPSPPSASSTRARALLDERYAKGEIDRDDYLQRKGDLEG
ncbi:MAG TPA: hypothetical protein ENH00_08960 [Actinobacteria bacterium]|nr:hypothetical protein BMS3Bbin01_02399 [bacterium BMS3Bbin01]HDH26306.1 hypothetical protein [Actinomycetota bacterium]